MQKTDAGKVLFIVSFVVITIIMQRNRKQTTASW
jgi:hypothetical protein